MRAWAAAIAQIRRSRGALLVSAALVAATGGVLVAFPEILHPRTFGRILVDSPEVYTRERLVNDRLLQGAWLMRRLVESDAPLQDVGSLQTLTDARSASLHASSTAPSAPGNAAAGTPQAASPDLRLAKRELLIDQVDYRDELRRLLIENQLDDRHDLGGNSLYMLKFDATVVPGDRTTSLASIDVRLHGPVALTSVSSAEDRVQSLRALGSPDEVSRWRSVYRDWLESLQSRLNQTHKDLKRGYSTNEFSHNDYARFIRFLLANLESGRGASSCPADFREIHSPDVQRSILAPLEHEKRKICIRSIVARSLASRPPAPSVGVAQGTGYIVEVPGGGSGGEESIDEEPSKATVQEPQEPARLRLAREEDEELDYWLNAFFAGKAIQLVLGIRVPESVFVGLHYFTIPALRELIRLSFFNPHPRAQDGNVFEVTPKIFSVFAIDPSKVDEAAYAKVAMSMPELYRKAFRSFTDFGPVPGLRVSRQDVAALAKEDYPLTEEAFQPVGVPGILRADAEVGLLNFASKARLRATAFTYAVTPKENSDTVLTTQSSRAAVSAAIPGTEEQAGGGEMDTWRGTVSRSLSRRGTVVGYGSAGSGDAETRFGWVLAPKLPLIRGTSVEFVQGPAQYSVSALVSIPSWWSEIKLEVGTGWIGRDGGFEQTPQVTHYSIEIPTDFEPLEASLLDVERLGPELMESRIDPILLTACRPGAILIPGRRLWRSTVVTLGYQTSDEISVLPDMKGIIARFHTIVNQASLEEQRSLGSGSRKFAPRITRVVRVWTSQGTVALPVQASIGIPEDCPAGRERPAS